MSRERQQPNRLFKDNFSRLLKEAEEKRRREIADEKARKSTEEAALRKANKAALEATGVVELFKQIQDSRVVTLTADEPATIKWSEDYAWITLGFDQRSDSYIDDNGYPHGGSWADYIQASVKNDVLKVCDVVVTPDQDLNKVVAVLIHKKQHPDLYRD
jgi:hypothetical protein